jgi:hypothetical protein
MSLYHKATAQKDENGTGRYLHRGTGSRPLLKYTVAPVLELSIRIIGARFAACVLRERYKLAGRLMLL